MAHAPHAGRFAVRVPHHPSASSRPECAKRRMITGTPVIIRLGGAGDIGKSELFALASAAPRLTFNACYRLMLSASASIRS